MRRAAIWLLRGLGALAVLVGIALAGIVGFANTDPGALFIARQITPLSGGTVTVSGVSGSIPAAPRIARIELRDREGVYATVEDASLDWSPSALVSRVARIDALTARRIVFARLPVSEPASAGNGGGGFSSPVRVELTRLRVDRIVVGASVIGTAFALAVDGRARFAALDDVDADITLTDADGSGTYHLIAGLVPGRIEAALTAREPAHGLAARLSGLPDLGALTLDASLRGPRDGAATTVALGAGPARIAAHGTADVDRVSGDLTLTATAPAMAPAPGIAFQSVDATAQLTGPLASPAASGHFAVAGFAAGGASVRQVTLTLSGDHARARAAARLEGVRLPGPRPELIEADPIDLTAELAFAGARPLRFTVTHPLVQASGTGTLQPPAVVAHLTAPDLAPFGALAGVVLGGSTALDVTARNGARTAVTLDGTLGLTAGPDPAPALLGERATLGVTASVADGTVTISRLDLRGQKVGIAATGTYGSTLGLDATVDLPDLSAAAATLSGRARLHAIASGKPNALTLDATLDGDVATRGVPSGHVTAAVSATGLPASPSGHVTAAGTLDGAPLNLAATIARDATATRLTIERATWRSARAEGALTLPAEATLPTGHLALRMARLDELRRLTGQALSGSLDATADLSAEAIAARLRAERVGVPGASVGRATLDARISDPLGAAVVDAKLAIEALRAGAATASARATVRGPRSALAVRTDAEATGVAGSPASLGAAAQIDVDRRRVALASLSATLRGETVRLLAPATLSWGDAILVDRLRLGLRDAVLDVAGRLSPTLDATASVRNLRADLARLADPTLAADGLVEADTRLTGPPDRPSGTIALRATGLHMRAGPASALAPASLVARATLAGRSARIDAALDQGANRLTLTGTLPIDPAGSLDVATVGRLDLAALDPLLAADGRRARGTVAIDAGIAGPMARPRARGTVRLSGGEIQDFGQGIRIDRIEAVLAASGDTVRVERFDGRAGQGTIAVSGSVGLAGSRPVDLHLVLAGATPLASDRLTARLASDVAIRGSLGRRLEVGGRVTIERADIRVPDRLPASVAVLDIRRPGQRPPAPPAPGPDVGLDVHLTAPGQIFVRGRGLDAELEGDLVIRGTAAAPRPEGRFQLRRGELSVAGKTLAFSSGEVGFDGSGTLDPTLNFVASNTTGGVTATLTVGGYASAPKITLSSAPELPQDEVLAHLLFGQSAASLGPFQLAEIAAALAQLSGATGGSFDPLDSVRAGLGLDRLSVGGGANGSSPSVEAGRYVARGVYVGAKQGTSGGGTQATVQVDITKGLKLETEVGTGGGSAQGSSGASSGGSSVGLTYQFEY